jgi:hypothetical protein
VGRKGLKLQRFIGWGVDNDRRASVLSIIIAILMFLAGFGIYYLVTWRRGQIDGEVLDTIIEQFLTTSFRPGDIANVMNRPREEVKTTLDQLTRHGMLKHHRGRYEIIIPLFFLSERHYQRALRLTANDEIMYGAAQQPFLSHFQLLAFYGLVPAAVIVSLLALFNIYPPLSAFFLTLFGYLESRIFFLFFVLVSVIIVDAINNLIKNWAQERFSVIIGAKAGIFFDETYATALSGRISRGKIGTIEVQISMLQKLLNYFTEIPHGDIIVKVRGQKEPEVFRNMPFPHEIYFVLRRVQLKGLGWRKRHARTLMMWRTRSLIPTVGRP